MHSRQDIANDIASVFGVCLLALPTPSPRYSVTADDPGRWDRVRPRVRRWLAERGWFLSADALGRVVLGPMQRVFPGVAYHATRRSSLAWIFSRGLLPGSGEARPDCEGLIFVCEKLGTPADAGIGGSYSAHWWRDHLARHHRERPADWCILGVWTGVLEAWLYLDPGSDSGVVIYGVERIPRQMLRMVWPRHVVSSWKP